MPKVPSTPPKKDSRIRDRIQRLVGRLLQVHWIRASLRGFLVRASAPKALTQRLPVNGEFEIDLAGKRCTYISGFNDGVGRALFWSGVVNYEPETLGAFIRIARESRVVFDVGANTGLFSIAAAAAGPEVNVHAFEPSPAVYAALKRNVHVNGLEQTITCYQLAVADREGTMHLHTPSRTWASARLGVDGFRGNVGHVQRVDAVTLDEHVERAGVDKVDLIKIDVEGAEDRVLAGARRVLGVHRPVVFCECLIESRAEVISDLLVEMGYRVLHLVDTGPMEVGRVRPDPAERFPNFLLMPEEGLGASRQGTSR